MANYSFDQIARVAYKAGFRGSALEKAVAIAWAESSGRTTVVNYLGCVGLWQVYQRVHHKAHPSWTTSWLKNPTNNAKAAWVLSSHGKNWRPWTTYTGGGYKKYLSSAKKAAAKVNKSKAKTPPKKTATPKATTPKVTSKKAYGTTDITALQSAMAIQHKTSIDHLYIMGAALSEDLASRVTSATLSSGIGSVTQVDMTIVDPGMVLLNGGYFKKGLTAHYQDFKLIISSVTTTDVGGKEAVNVKMRSKIVHDLKNRVGTKVYKNSSPSEFVINECKAVGAKYVVQGSARRTQVARDTAKSGEKYQADSRPSSWTTFSRLADEVGFVVFECAGVVFFGKPSWLTEQFSKDPVKVEWKYGVVQDYVNETIRPISFPECTSSLDGDTGADISVVLPMYRFYDIRLGRALLLSGVPNFNGTYMITNIDFPLAGGETITVNAEIPEDPEANPPDSGNSSGSNGSNNGGSSSGSTPTKTVTSYVGSNPLKSMQINCKYGVRGSWAAGYHTGTDLRASVGTKAYAVYDGTITGDNWGSAYGTHIVLKTKYGKFLYAHMSRKYVKKGQKVKAGKVIGLTGNTGRTTGPHLHFELRVSPYRYGKDTRNPMGYLRRKVTTTTIVKKSASSTSKGRKGGKTAGDFVAFALKQKGDRYRYGAEASMKNPNPSVWDCVEKGTLLFTPNGPTPIEELRVGDPVWSIDPDTGNLAVKPVKTTFPMLEHKAWVIETAGRKMRMSYNHHAMIVKKVRERDDRGKWLPVRWVTEKIDARDVKRGDYVLVPHSLPDVGLPRTFAGKELTEDVAWLLGFYIGDGSFMPNGISIAAYKPEHRAKVIDIYKSIYPNGRVNTNSIYSVSLQKSSIRQDMIDFGFSPGARSYTKVFPQNILGATHAIKKAFLDGYVAADGHIDARGDWTLGSASKRMIDQARTIAIEVGYRVSKITFNKRTKPIEIKGVPVVNARPLYSFQMYPPKPGVRSNDDSLLMETYGGRRSFPCGVVIKKVTASYGTEDIIETYDIEVADTHTIMGDIVVRQCSELVQWAAYQAGIHSFPDSSGNQYSYCRRKGKAVSVSSAIKTKGALLFNGSGGGSHVAISLGNGKTIEAANSRVGVVSYSAHGRGWSVAARVPGLKY